MQLNDNTKSITLDHEEVFIVLAITWCLICNSWFRLLISSIFRFSIASFSSFVNWSMKSSVSTSRYCWQRRQKLECVEKIENQDDMTTNYPRWTCQKMINEPLDETLTITSTLHQQGPNRKYTHNAKCNYLLQKIKKVILTKFSEFFRAGRSMDLLASPLLQART